MEETQKTGGRTRHAHPTEKPTAAEETSCEKLQQEIEALNSRLEDAQKEAATNLDGWQRERAEFSNYKKGLTAIMPKRGRILPAKSSRNTLSSWMIWNSPLKTNLKIPPDAPGRKGSN